eukprot:TRINITY_DN722_c0_g1_i3.p1 TRINITY_DN722_c0_g1~~TRINITY_DN722_c0_g1_i3.p1  ORF type:complete len:661 (-),score=112.24 TRINITY_DN722_c0_g1_i3:124-2106(-)
MASVVLLFAILTARTTGDSSVGCSNQSQCTREEDVVSVSLSQRRLVKTKLMNSVGSYVPGEPGQPWTEEEALIVKAKLQYLASNAEDYMEAYMEELNAAGTPFECATEPATNFTTPCDGSWPDPLCTKKVCKIFNNEPNVDNFAAKMLRLGFHDCFKYEDGVGGGCDGCLNFGTMFRKYSQTNNFQKRIWPDGVDVGSGNNGLAIVADLLEKVYTDPNYPDSLPVGGFEGERPKTLSASLQSTGKSRSDLWAFAAMVGAEWGALQNNMACDETPGRDKEKYKHLYNSIGLGDICKMTQNTPPTFRTGRRDCPDADKPADPATSSYVPHRARPYETAKSENQAGVYFNGTQLAEFFRNDFGMTRQETVAIMGAHSFGGYSFKNSMFKYQWMWHQAHMMNSNYYRILQSKPSKFVDYTGKDGKTWLSAGGPGGVNAETGFFYRPLRETVSGGPFFWFHMYNRCPLCEKNSDGTWTSYEDRGDSEFQTDRCCSCNDAANAEDVPSECWAKTSRDETYLTSDMALYHSFVVSENGAILGGNGTCPGIDTSDWTLERLADPSLDELGKLQGGINDWEMEPLCNKNLEQDDGDSKTMSDWVEHYGDNPSTWLADFFKALEKMSGNGYEAGELTQGPSVVGLGLTTCERSCKKKRKEKCAYKCEFTT